MILTSKISYSQLSYRPLAHSATEVNLVKIILIGHTLAVVEILPSCCLNLFQNGFPRHLIEPRCINYCRWFVQLTLRIALVYMIDVM